MNLFIFSGLDCVIQYESGARCAVCGEKVLEQSAVKNA